MRARNIDREIDRLQKEKEEVWDRLLKVTQSYTGDVVQSTKDPHKFDAILEYQQDIDRYIQELMTVKGEIIRAISRLEDGRLREILTLRYIQGKTFEEIAVAVKYSYKQTCRLHGRALIKLEVMDGPWK